MIAKEIEFKIKVILGKNDTAIVEIQDAYRDVEGEDAPFIFWMAACEYLLHKTAQKSEKPYEDAIDLLIRGAMTYKNLRTDEEKGQNT